MTLSDEERKAALEGLPGWRYDEAAKAISREFRFADFAEAFAFMTRVALAAEQAAHHPEWTNVWNRVAILLTTHDESGVTGKDMDLAEKINRFAGQLGVPAESGNVQSG